jgi:hypothetical protein
LNSKKKTKKPFEKDTRRAFAIREKGYSNVDAKMDPKIGVNGKKRFFDRIKLSNIQKNRVFMTKKGKLKT